MVRNNSIDSSSAPFPRGASSTKATSWNTSNSFVTGWVNSQSIPSMREQPLPPAQFCAPSNTSPVTETAKEVNNDDADKKNRRLSINTVRSTVGKRRNSIIASGQELTNRVSALYHNVFPPSSNNTVAPSFIPRSSQSSLPRLANLVVPSMRFIFVGDSGCGKSTLLMRSYRGVFVDGLKKTKFESITKTVQDTSGDAQLNQLKLLSYLAFDAVFLCFALDNTAGFVEAQNKWIDDIQKNYPNAPIILLGLKKDTCIGPGMRAPKIHPHLFSAIRKPQNSQDHQDVDSKLKRSVKYIECSAKTGYNVDRVFQEGAKLVLAEREEQAALERNKKKAGSSSEHKNVEGTEQEHVAARTKESSSRGLSKFFCFN